MKKYKEIIDGEIESKLPLEASKELALFQQKTSLALSKVGDVHELAKLANTFLPEVTKNQLLAFDGLEEGLKPVWNRLIEEGMTAGGTLPKRRTNTEKRMAVLQANRHPTAGSKWHQANLEQGVWFYKAVDARKAYEKKKIELEKMLYKYRKKEDNIKNLQNTGEDTFIKEKNLELMRIDLLDKLHEINRLKDEVNNVAHEVLEWSEIKEELYKEANASGEYWSPDHVDEGGAQEVPLVIRHLENFITSIKYASEGGNNTSDMLNISGLALTAIKEGQKNNRLGIYLNSLSDDNIYILWKNIFGTDIKVIRQNNIMILLMFKDLNKQDTFIGGLNYPTTMEAWKNWVSVQEEFNKTLSNVESKE